MKPASIASLLKRMQNLGSPRDVEGMARFGIVSKKVYGISVVTLRTLARGIGRNHGLAAKLWASGFLEARILAALIEEPGKVTVKQMERWVRDFDNWATCDACCSVVFDKTPHAWRKAVEWSRRKPEFVKRAGYALMAVLAVHDKKADDKQFARLFPHIKRGATDGRNFVKKAVNWALRQIGKRNRKLNKLAIKAARDIHAMDSRSAKWIASDALRELTSGAVQRRLKRR